MQCGNPLSSSATNQETVRSPPALQEVLDFLRYMDCLTAIRMSATVRLPITVLLVAVHILFGIGMASRFIQPIYGIACWVVMALLFVVIGGRELTVRCPRCAMPFRYRTVLGFKLPGGSSDRCATCGLRALSPSEMQSWLDHKEPLDAAGSKGGNERDKHWTG